MYTSLKDLREPTLEATYLKLIQFIKSENHGDKSALKDIVDARIHKDWDAFDQSLRLIIVDAARLDQELARILFETNQGVIRRAVKCDWFFCTTPVSFFTDEVLPVVSVSTRLKVISALGRVSDEGNSVRLFEWVRHRFGLRVAEPLLKGCPESYVSGIVLSDTRAVSPQTFLSISRKYPELGVKMAAHWIKLDRPVPSVVSKRLRLQPELLADWKDEHIHQLQFQIGRKLLVSWRGRLRRMGPPGLTLLAQGVEGRVFRRMTHKERVQRLVHLVHPSPSGRFDLKTWDRAFADITNLIKPFPAESREQLLHDTFQALFERDLWSSAKASTPSLLELVTADRRADLLSRLELFDEEYLYLKPAAEAVPELMQRVKRCPDAMTRCKLVKAMIKSCVLVWNIALLQSVLEFVEDHYRDDYILTKSVLLSLHPQHSSMVAIFPLAKRSSVLTALPIAACRAVASIVHSLMDHCPSDVYELLYVNELYLTRCLEAEEGVDAALSAWLRDIISVLQAPWVCLTLIKFPKAPLAKNIFMLLYNSWPKLMEEAPESDQEFLNCFVRAAGETGVKLVDTEDKGVKVFECLDKEVWLCEDLARTLWRSKDIRHYSGSGLWAIYCREQLLTDLFRLRPDLIIRDLSELLEKISQFPYQLTRFLRSRRLFAFYKLDEKISAWCERKFSGDSGYKVEILFIYSFVATLESYQRLAGDYLIQGARIDTSRENSFLLLKAPYHLKNLDSPPGDLFPLVRGCLIGGGDLFYEALPTFHKACYNVPFASAVPEILPLLEAPVSVMKKAVALVGQICPRDVAAVHLRQCWTTAKHYSARTVLLERLMSFFLDDPSSETWEAAKQCITESDDPLLPSLPQLSSVPPDFVKEFSETMWKMLTALPPSKNKRDAENRLLSDALKCVELLSDYFCKALIRPTLFTPNSSFDDLAVKYLAVGQAPVPEKIHFVSTVFKERVDLHPDAVVKFLKAMTTAQRSEVFVFLPEFMRSFEDDLKRADLFEGRLPLLYLDIIQKTLKEGNEDFVAIGAEIVKLWRSEPDRAFLHPLLTRSLQMVFKSSLDIHRVIQGMLHEDDPAVSIAMLQALPHDEPWEPCTVDTEEEKEEDVADHEEGSTDEDVQSVGEKDTHGTRGPNVHRVILNAFRSNQNSTFQLYLKQYLTLESYDSDD